MLGCKGLSSKTLGIGSESMFFKPKETGKVVQIIYLKRKMCLYFIYFNFLKYNLLKQKMHTLQKKGNLSFPSLTCPITFTTEAEW